MSLKWKISCERIFVDTVLNDDQNKEVSIEAVAWVFSLLKDECNKGGSKGEAQLD